MSSRQHEQRPPPHSTFISPPSASTTAGCGGRWWSEETVAVVTGANKGIGYALVKRLALLGLTVVLTARDHSRGLSAMESLKKVLGFHLHRNLHFCLLDISDPSSINSFLIWFRSQFHALDILINNAAVCFNGMKENSVEDAERVMKTNYYGTKLLTEALLPFFRRNSPCIGRILNISSRLGLLDKVKNKETREVFGKDEEGLTEEKIDGVVSVFLKDVKEGRWKSEGWPETWTDYSMSKLALNAYSKVLAKRYKLLLEEGDYNEAHHQQLSVNCFCPGFTKTSMTDGNGKHSADEAAQMAASVALLPPHRLTTGVFYAGSTTRGSISSKL